MVISDPHFCIRIFFIFCDNDVKYMAVVDMLHFDRGVFQEISDLIHLVFGYMGDDLKLFFRISGNDPGGRSGWDSFEVIGVGNDHALDIFDNASADLQNDPVRDISQYFTSSGSASGRIY